MYQDVSNETVAQIIAKYYSSSNGLPEIQKVSTGKFNSTFFVTLSDQEVVVRIAPPEGIGYIFYEFNMMAQEPEIHCLLRKKTAVPVPEIFIYDTERDILDSDYLIMEKMPGTPATEASFLTTAMWNYALRQVGQHLRTVHRLIAERYGYLGAHQPMIAQTDWYNAFRIMWEKMINQIVEINAYSRDEGDFMLDLWQSYRDIFDRDVQASLLHMDIWHQNILVDQEGIVTGIVDWDRALWGDPEIEFAVLDYCGISEPAFWEGYGQERDLSPEAQIRRIFYYLYEVQKYIIIRGTRGGDWDRAMQYRDQSLRIAHRSLA